ncbi:acidic leucine-rich nuclear phosphoprotein 32 family member A isoform X1 [Danaus plexippus]|uniref:Mapmodulin protein n=1 Tax=Danaus plexippus plexippus TaxID=278856 RepID=A0A212F9Y8_DANPL|nr:acidic leucine-rich nuclear phosphoprotein 32 family member A isoform X1 [Danaus plexippus]OWR50552.1 putative mapmodulin protein [Danaus plexippus plexippus]
MEKRLVLELRGRSPSQIQELNLDNCKSTAIIGLTDEYTNLENLSLINAGLTTLKGFPTLPKLRKLELSDNRISQGLNFLSGCKKLTHLNLSGNKIKDLETLKPLQEFENLRNLDLFYNDVTNIEDYRSKVFAMHPSLKYLDGFDKEDREGDDSEADEDDAEEMNGNNDSDEEDLDLDLASLAIDDSISEGSSPSLLVSLYTVYGLLFHLGYIMKKSGDDDDDVSLRAVYRDNLVEESSGSSLYEGEEEEEDDDDDDDDDTHKEVDQNTHEEESTRGKKRKHEDDEN